VRFRPSATNIIDELEVNPPSLPNFDAAFALQLTATDILSPLPQVGFNEVSAASSSSFWLEIINYGNTTIDLGGLRCSQWQRVRRLTPLRRNRCLGRMVSLSQAQLGLVGRKATSFSLRARALCFA